MNQTAGGMSLFQAAWQSFSAGLLFCPVLTFMDNPWTKEFWKLGLTALQYVLLSLSGIIWNRNPGVRDYSAMGGQWRLFCHPASDRQQ